MAQYILNAVTDYAAHKPWASSVTIFSVICLLTRLWSGYIKSRMERSSNNNFENARPPILPYWLPFIGHALSAAWSLDEVVRKGRDATDSGMFSLYMAGTKHNFVCMPSLARQMHLQRPSVINSDAFLYWIMDKYFGDDGACKAVPAESFHNVHKSLNSLLREPFLSNANVKTQQIAEATASQLITFPSAGENDTVAEANMFPLTMNWVADLAARVLMGHRFVENFPDLILDFWVFDDGFNALISGVPGFTRRKAKAQAARSRIMAALKEWYDAVSAMLEGKEAAPGSRWGDLSDVSEVMRKRVLALKAENASDKFCVTQIAGVYWGLMVNSNKVIFWMLWHIVSDATLLAQIRAEIDPHITQRTTASMSIDLDGLLSSPMFLATFYESMRHYTTGVSYKKVHTALTLTESAEDAAVFTNRAPLTYHIPKGEFLAIWTASMQTDSRIWKDPSKFDPSRFLVTDADGKGIRAESGNLEAFGGGQSMCKGRVFAVREALICVAALVVTWDFSPASGSAWKWPGKHYNGTGTTNPNSLARARISRRSF